MILRIFHLHLVCAFFFVAYVQAGERSLILEDFLKEQNQVDDRLTSEEWKKFKYFENQLSQAPITPKEKEMRLKNYAKDSIQILRVKLIAIQSLDEKDLLHRDILENRDYYIALLNKLRESEISPIDYRFLEEKMAYLNQPVLKQKLDWSTGLNIGFIAMILILTSSLIYLKKRPNKSQSVTLSKQETLVRNLILQGKSNKEIANELYVSLSTVKSHITSIYSKLNVSSRGELLQNSTGTST